MTAWPAFHLSDPRVVVLDAAVFAMGDYVTGHVPGARLVESTTLITRRTPTR